MIVIHTGLHTFIHTCSGMSKITMHVMCATITEEYSFLQLTQRSCEGLGVNIKITFKEYCLLKWCIEEIHHVTSCHLYHLWHQLWMAVRNKTPHMVLFFTSLQTLLSKSLFHVSSNSHPSTFSFLQSWQNTSTHVQYFKWVKSPSKPHTRMTQQYKEDVVTTMSRGGKTARSGALSPSGAQRDRLTQAPPR